MARYGIILLLAALVGLIVTDLQGVPGQDSGNRASPGTAIAADTGGSSTPGVTVTRRVPSARESLSEVQALAPFREQPPSGDRHIPRRKIPRPADTGIFTPQLSLSLSSAAPISSAPVLMAPALDTAFPNGFTGLGNPTAGDVIPPDTMGAAGPAHLVSLLNSNFGVFNKTTGALQSNISTRSFWASLGTGPGQPADSPFDPKILYDTNSGRFVAITLGVDNDALGNSIPPSWLMIAVSSQLGPQDPNAWVKVAIRADLDNNAQQFYNWADFPSLGVDADNIYVAANMFDNTANPRFQYSKVWVIPKNQLLSSPPADLTWTEIRQPLGSGDSMQPAHTFGTAPAEYVIRESDSGQLRLATITGGTTWTDLGPVPVASFTSTSILPGAPQFGDPRTIDTGDTRLLNAVFRNGSLWTTHHVLGASGKVEVAWYQINPVGGTLPVSGRIGDPLRWYFYPSIAVNVNGDVAVGFSGSSSIEYASAYYTARRSIDPAGSMQPPSLLKTGVAAYFKTLSGTENRWGDFSATVVDPSDNVTFWTLQEYAAAPAVINQTLRSMWGTWWGKFQPPAIASPLLTDNLVSATQIDLAWTLPGGQTGFRVERRQLPVGDFNPITANLGLGIQTYIDNTRIAGISYSYRVRALSPAPGPDSYSNEVTTATVAPPPAAPVGGGGGGGCGISHGKTREGDASPLSTVIIILSPAAGIMIIRRHLMRSSR